MAKAPGKYFRHGLTLLQAAEMFSTDAKAEAWLVNARWRDGVCCPRCGSVQVQTGAAHANQPYRCREKECGKRFSVRTGTVMAEGKIHYRHWALAIYLFSTNIKGVSSMRLHRELGITQKSAWFLAHRLRQAWDGPMPVFAGPVEVDETFAGGLEKNKHASQPQHAGRGFVGKVAIAGVKDRRTKRVSAAVVSATDGPTLRRFIADRTADDATVYTDDHTAYHGMANHAAVKHTVGEYVNGQIHTNGIESFWSLFKRGFKGIYHKMSPAHLDRYVAEFVGRHNARPLDTHEQMGAMVRGFDCKRLTYKSLIADTGLPTGARQA